MRNKKFLWGALLISGMVFLVSFLNYYDRKIGIKQPEPTFKLDSSYVEMRRKNPIKIPAKYSEFIYAMPGEIWQIEDKSIAVMKRPAVLDNKSDFLRNVVTLIKPEDKVKVVDTEGIARPWKKVHLYDRRDIIYASGWVRARTVKKSRKLTE